MVRIHAYGARGCKQHVRGGDHPLGAFDREGGCDFPHDGVDGRVEPEGFADDVLDQCKFLQMLICQGLCNISLQYTSLLSIQLLHNRRLGGQMQHNPRAGHRG